MQMTNAPLYGRDNLNARRKNVCNKPDRDFFGQQMLCRLLQKLLVCSIFSRSYLLGVWFYGERCYSSISRDCHCRPFWIDHLPLFPVWHAWLAVE